MLEPDADSGVPPAGAPVDQPADPPMDVPGEMPPPSEPPPAANAVSAEPAKVYDIPSARTVVGSGLQLAFDAGGAIRRASIYIGLLALGAFGPAVLLLLFGIGRLMSDPAAAATMTSNPSLIFFEQPQLAEPLTTLYALLGLGLVMLVGISVDAQAMAIAILGGHASDRPMTLPEAITRARQVFWRLIGAGFLVEVVAGIVTLVLTLPFIRPFDSNTGVTFIGSFLGTLVVTPFAFASAGIVLGNVGPVDALRRSVRLFRARPRIALAVTLFTLVTATIQTFAIEAGADAAIRVGDFLHLSLGQSAGPAIVATILVLAFVVAFGSLTFTIATIVAAPQVTGFLGLTHYSSGLDLARSPDATRPPRFHWVTRPMLATMVLLVVIAGLGLPSITGLRLRTASPILALLSAAADGVGALLLPFGSSTVVDDPAGDELAADRPTADILGGEYAYLTETPSWLLDGVFACGATGVTCPVDGSDARAFDSDGALLFAQRMAAAPGTATEGRSEWAAVFRIEAAQSAPARLVLRYPGASHAVITTFEGDRREVSKVAYSGNAFGEEPTDARSLWSEDVLITIIPARELANELVRWDVSAFVAGRTPEEDSFDTLRVAPLLPMLDAEDPPFFTLLSDFGAP